MERAAIRIAGYPHLVQRLRHFEKPKRGSSTPPKISGFFNFDYMGSAEFEFGAIPAAKKELRDALAAAGWPPPAKMESGKRVFWFVGPRSAIIPAALWLPEEIKEAHTGMKERSGLKDAIEKPTEWTPNGWWRIDKGEPPFALFLMEQAAKDFIKGVRGS